MTIPPLRGNRLRWGGLAVALGFIGLATLIPEYDAPKPDVVLTCLLCGDLGGPDLILNVVLFMPLGLALASLGARPRGALCAGFALSVAIEVTQVILPGRATTLRDVGCNAAGALLGAIITLNLPLWLAPSRRTALRLAAATCAALATTAVTGWLFAFAPSDAPYYGHWSPKQEHLERWTGSVTRATLDGLPVPPWLIDEPESLRAAIADGFALEITGVGGAQTSDLGGIVTISDARMSELLLVGQRNADLVVRVRRRAARLRLGAPEARFERLMLAAPEGAPLDLRVSAAASRTCASVNGTSGCLGRPGAGSSWVLLFTDRGTTATVRILLNAITLGLMAVPVGMLLSGVAAASRTVVVFLLVVGTASAARATGLAQPSLPDWIGLAVGLAAGIAVNRLVSRAARHPTPAPVK